MIVLFILIGEIFLMQNVNSFLWSWVSSFYKNPFLLAAIIPIKSYSNAEADKATILKENTNKSGIYMWTNNINNQKYIGSSENLRARFLKYFNNNHLLSNTWYEYLQSSG